MMGIGFRRSAPARARTRSLRRPWTERPKLVHQTGPKTRSDLGVYMLHLHVERYCRNLSLEDSAKNNFDVAPAQVSCSGSRSG